MSRSKQEIVQIVNEGFRQNNPEVFLEHCTETVRWTMLGEFVAEGKEAIRKFFTSNTSMPLDEAGIQLDLTIVEADKVASTGTMSMQGKEGEKTRYAFCDIYLFEGDLVREMSSYLVKLKQENEKS